MGPKNAGLAKKLGYTNIRVMLQGVPGWKKSGQSVVASHNFIANGNNVIVDVRSQSEAVQGHIPRAVNIPLSELADMEDDFPDNKSAPIVVYGNGQDSSSAYKTVKGWGYKTASLVDGGLEGWLAKGGRLETGAAASEIVWVRKLGENEVSVTDFRKALSDHLANTMILDVRGPDETSGGLFESAINIPLDELPKRLGDLSRDKELLIHCTTGARAEMAFDVVSKAGLKARYLVADVECEGGSCQIIE